MGTDQELLRQIAELEQQLASIKQRVGMPSCEAVEPPPGPAAAALTSRRRMLGAAGAAAAGAALVLGSGQPAAADDPNDVVKDADNAVSGTTRLTGGQFTARDAGATSLSPFEGSVNGIAGDVTFNGVVGSTKRGTGYGLVGMADRANAARSQLLLQPNGGPPPSSSSHRAGELAVDSTGTLWYATQGDPSPEFVTLAGPDAAGAFYPVEPTRIHDSRRPLPSPGSLSTGGSKVLSVASGRDINTGAVTVNDLVPEGATAVAFNLTITQTRLEGFLSMAPGDATTFKASTINWFGPGQILANAGIVKLDSNRQVKLFCGGGGGTHFVVDITGYYI